MNVFILLLFGILAIWNIMLSIDVIALRKWKDNCSKYDKKNEVNEYEYSNK